MLRNVPRILIADDHAMMRKGLRTAIEPHSDWIICGEAINGQDAPGETAYELHYDQAPGAFTSRAMSPSSSCGHWPPRAISWLDRPTLLSFPP